MSGYEDYEPAAGPMPGPSGASRPAKCDTTLRVRGGLVQSGSHIDVRPEPLDGRTPCWWPAPLLRSADLLCRIERLILLAAGLNAKSVRISPGSFPRDLNDLNVTFSPWAWPR